MGLASSDAAGLVSLDQARAYAGQGRCVCGHGIFRQLRDGGPFQCEACHRVRREPAQGPPKLAFRCRCGSCLFLVALTGIECAACSHAIAFGDLFDAVLAGRAEAPR